MGAGPVGAGSPWLRARRGLNQPNGGFLLQHEDPWGGVEDPARPIVHEHGEDRLRRRGRGGIVDDQHGANAAVGERTDVVDAKQGDPFRPDLGAAGLGDVRGIDVRIGAEECVSGQCVEATRVPSVQASNNLARRGVDFVLEYWIVGLAFQPFRYRGGGWGNGAWPIWDLDEQQEFVFGAWLCRTLRRVWDHSPFGGLPRGLRRGTEPKEGHQDEAQNGGKNRVTLGFHLSVTAPPPYSSAARSGDGQWRFWQSRMIDGDSQLASTPPTPPSLLREAGTEARPFTQSECYSP